MEAGPKFIDFDCYQDYTFGALMKTATTTQPVWLSPNLTPLNVAVIMRLFYTPWYFLAQA